MDREYLHAALVNAYPGVTIYYTPSGNMMLEYPCLSYSKKADEPAFASNTAYAVGGKYDVILMHVSGETELDSTRMFGITGVVIRSNTKFVSGDICHAVFTVSVNSISS